MSVLCGPMQKLSYVKIILLAACPSSNPDSALFLQRLFEAPITHTLPVDATNDNDLGLLIGRRAVSFTASFRMCLSFLKIVFDTWLHLCLQDTICVAPLLSKCRLCFVCNGLKSYHATPVSFCCSNIVWFFRRCLSF